MPSQKNKDWTSLLEEVVQQHKNGLPFVLYRNPNQKMVHALFQNDDVVHITTDFLDSGFVFAPFDFHGEAILLKPDFTKEIAWNPSSMGTNKGVDTNVEGKSKHIALVAKGIETIKRKKLQKVVLSRKLTVAIEDTPWNTYTRLLDSYPRAMCYLWSHPKIGMWMGATPETLVEINGRECTTVSLAGTLSSDSDAPPNWTTKEQEEQLLVTTYIKAQLAPLSNRVQEEAVTSAKAGKLWHLKSVLKAGLKKSTTVAQLIASLHPTPAVCGVPVKEAFTFIKEQEGYDRQFYTGFLGPLHLQESGKSHLFVNLRCVELYEQSASVYIGGGITKDSIPLQEWEETVAKSKTILSIL